MPREWHPVRAVLRYTTLVGVVALVTVPVYVFVEPPLRAVIARGAVAVVFAVAIFELRGTLLRARSDDGRSALDDARRRGAPGPEIPQHFLALIDDVRAGVRNRRYFEQSFWPRLVELASRPPTPPPVRALGRGPALADLRDTVSAIENER